MTLNPTFAVNGEKFQTTNPELRVTRFRSFRVPGGRWWAYLEFIDEDKEKRKIATSFGENGVPHSLGVRVEELEILEAEKIAWATRKNRLEHGYIAEVELEAEEGLDLAQVFAAMPPEVSSFGALAALNSFGLSVDVADEAFDELSEETKRFVPNLSKWKKSLGL